MKKLLGLILSVSLLSSCNTNVSGNIVSGNVSNIDTKVFLSEKMDEYTNKNLKAFMTNNVDTIEPNKAFNLTFTFKDINSNSSIEKFTLEHEKYMHVVLVKKDFSKFNHVHPTLFADGSFRLRLNQPTTDPDNQDSMKAIEESGDYYIFSEIKPEKLDKTQEIRFGIKVEGNSNYKDLELDEISESGIITKYINELGKSSSENDSKYKVEMKILRNINTTKIIQFMINVQQKNGEVFQDVTDIQQWLSLDGHAILISENGNDVMSKDFRHLKYSEYENNSEMHAYSYSLKHGFGHVEEDNETGHIGPDLKFAISDEDILPSGNYKLWVQFRHNNKVITAPYVFKL